MTDNEIIAALGGPAEVAAELSNPDSVIVASDAVRGWMRRGKIPSQYRRPIQRMAERHGIDLPQSWVAGR